jgi:hypothetical protein
VLCPQLEDPRSNCLGQSIDPVVPDMNVTQIPDRLITKICAGTVSDNVVKEYYLAHQDEIPQA